MDARFYNSEEIDIERLASDLVNVYTAQGYQAQQIGNKDQVLVQLKKGGDFEAIIGMQAALSITLQRTTGGVLAMIGQQKWLDKAAVGAVGIAVLPVLWPLALTAGVGALRQASLGNQALNMVDGLVRQQRPGIQVGPVPVQLLPQMQQQWAPSPPTPVYTPPPQIASTPAMRSLPAPASSLRCSSCNTPYEPGDTFCSGCGRSLTPPRQYCSNCNTELKAGASFCPKCGASSFHTLPGTQQVPAKPIPPAPPTPTYTPPPVQPQSTPYYTPSAQQTPVYTPPTQQTPVYTPPPTVEPEPTIQAKPAPTPAPPPEPYYVPPVTQNPPVAPQPKVTLIQSSPKQESPAQPPQRPQKQYYIPSNQAQATESAASLASQTTIADTVAASPASQPTIANATWGVLTFEDGSQTQLKGERAVIGRYDHDLGGIEPDVDLSKKKGADTVSRVHAALELVGNTYSLTDLNSTNATRINGKRLEADKPTPVNDGDALQFGKVTCTFHKA